MIDVGGVEFSLPDKSCSHPQTRIVELQNYGMVLMYGVRSTARMRPADAGFHRLTVRRTVDVVQFWNVQTKHTTRSEGSTKLPYKDSLLAEALLLLILGYGT
jgi:hypothetical protein